MITAIDTNVLLDFFTADPQFGPTSTQLLQDAASAGCLVVCDIVFAEISSSFASSQAASTALNQLGIHFDALGEKAAHLAGHTFHQYRKTGGPRTRVIADFLIGAHALIQSERLLTRDRGYYRTYFPSLTIL